MRRAGLQDEKVTASVVVNSAVQFGFRLCWLPSEALLLWFHPAKLIHPATLLCWQGFPYWQALAILHDRRHLHTYSSITLHPTVQHCLLRGPCNTALIIPSNNATLYLTPSILPAERPLQYCYFNTFIQYFPVTGPLQYHHLIAPCNTACLTPSYNTTIHPTWAILTIYHIQIILTYVRTLQ